MNKSQNIEQSPRLISCGITVDKQGRILVVDKKRRLNEINYKGK